jgi:hypothetical protein
VRTRVPLLREREAEVQARLRIRRAQSDDLIEEGDRLLDLAVLEHRGADRLEVLRVVGDQPDDLPVSARATRRADPRAELLRQQAVHAGENWLDRERRLEVRDRSAVSPSSARAEARLASERCSCRS